MIEVKVKFRSNQDEELIINVPGFTKLTPRAARAALEIVKMQSPERDAPRKRDDQLLQALQALVYTDAYGYIVYENSARKVYFNKKS